MPNSDDEHLRGLYDEGVLMGCVCLTVCSASAFVCSVIADYALEKYKIALKHFALYSFIFHLLVIGAIAIKANMYTAVMLAVSTGLLFTVVDCVAFTLASDFEVRVSERLTVHVWVYVCVHIPVSVSNCTVSYRIAGYFRGANIS